MKFSTGSEVFFRAFPRGKAQSARALALTKCDSSTDGTVRMKKDFFFVKTGGVRSPPAPRSENPEKASGFGCGRFFEKAPPKGGMYGKRKASRDESFR